jgi:Bacterial Ig-like domain (group 3)
MRSNRPQGAASNSRSHRVRAGVVRVLSVTAVAATACAMMAGAASAATAAPAAGTTTTTTTITTASPGTVDAGKPFTIAVKVTGAGGTPSGTVAIAPTGATLPASYSCTAMLAGGVGSCAVTPGVGTFGDIDYVATYSGDTTFAGSASTVTFELIVPETTTTSVSPATASPGSVTLTATVVGQDKGNISPSAGGTGSVTFYNDGAVISTACAAVSLTYDGGGANLARCKTPTLAAGTYTITAKYSGDPNNLASSGTETLTVKAPPPAKHATKTHGSAKPGSTKTHRVVTLWATVTSPGRTPGGKVTFMWRGHVVCSARLSHGKAHCSIEFLRTGTYRIRAWYAGNSTFDSSHSAFFEVKIRK